jgi:hypothetical protein
MSDKTVAEKLRIKPGTTVWCSPAEHLKRIGPLPEGVGSADGPATAATAIVFVDDEASLRRVLADHGADLAQPNIVWIAYPKGGASDINRDKLPPILGELSMRPIGQIAVDETWSALRFRPLKPGEGPFEGGRR